MKRILALLLAALMLLSGLSAFAEGGTFYEEMGFALDIDDIQGRMANCVELQPSGVVLHEPFAAMMIVMYYALPEQTVKTVEAEIAKAEDDTEKAMLTYTLQMMGSDVGLIIATNAESLADTGIRWPLPEGYGVTEFGAMGDYRWHYISGPVDDLLDIIDDMAASGNTEIEPETLKQSVLADAAIIQAELPKKLEAAALSEPVDNDTGHVGEVLSFETTDLDGNPVKSEDLFRNNKITMVNLWGTWCSNCMNEMADLAALHTRLQAKGCGIVGVEYEGAPVEGALADEARAVMAQYGTNYPNVIIPEDNPIFDGVIGYPTSFFVDSAGTILTYPIAGAAVEMYEPTIDKLLAGEAAPAAPAAPAADATANDSGTYRVIVRDAGGNPVKGAVVQLCDDTTCTLQKTKADGVATFQVETPKVYEVHVLKVPEGFEGTDAVYKTLDTFSDVNITLGAPSDPAPAEAGDCPQIEVGILSIQKYGNLVLGLSREAFLNLGYEYGDVITAKLGDKSWTAPVCNDYSDVDTGAPICRVNQTDTDDGKNVLLAINGGNLATWLGIAERETIDDAPGFRWNWAEGFGADSTVTLSLEEKGGYLEQIKLHQLQMSNNRADYPDLTDEQYANFRNVATAGMGAHVLYRSSSPVDPKYNRNKGADAAVNGAGIRTVINLTDSADAMKGYEDYAQTYYSQLDILPLDLVLDFSDDSFREGLAKGFRYMIDHDGPYLIHCTIGKDRAGFTSAVLECLMGATADEVVADYMVSYYNYYGVKPGTESYEALADNNIRKFLAKAFGVDDLAGADLAASAEAYLKSIGLNADEIAALKTRLATDIA